MIEICCANQSEFKFLSFPLKSLQIGLSEKSITLTREMWKLSELFHFSIVRVNWLISLRDILTGFQQHTHKLGFWLVGTKNFYHNEITTNLQSPGVISHYVPKRTVKISLNYKENKTICQFFSHNFFMKPIPKTVLWSWSNLDRLRIPKCLNTSKSFCFLKSVPVFSFNLCINC